MTDRWSVRAASSAVILLWCGAILTSLLGFYYAWGKLPALSDIVVGGVMLGGIALPLSFVQGLGVRIPLDNILIVAAFYWPVLLFAHYQFLTRRRPQLFGALVILVALSAWRWQFNAQGLMGI